MDTAILEQLDSVEDFMNCFQVKYDPAVTNHRRIHLLRLFHTHLGDNQSDLTWQDYHNALTKAYCQVQQGMQPEFAPSRCEQCSSQCDT